MIHIGEAPLRLTLGGGGTDLPGYVENHGGFCITATINKVVTVIASRTWDDRIRLAYSKFENVPKVDYVEHTIIRAALRHCRIYSGIEIHSMSDAPSGTGLGSSSAFTVALLRSLYHFKGEFEAVHDHERLAEESHYLESRILGARIGKQDQYACTHRGTWRFHFHKDGSVTPALCYVTPDDMLTLGKRVSLHYTGYAGSAEKSLESQVNSMRDNTERMHAIRKLGFDALRYLESGALDDWGMTLHHHWLIKRELSADVSSDPICQAYKVGISAGAIGGKLVGAGGRGFLMFYSHSPEDRIKVTEAMTSLGFTEFPYQFE